ncbi:class I SAM-dependent methyltransferase [Parasedimentitalea maritima]|nr:class I SAM-dependent methyltransferase [Zongyanglinia marina]
MDLRGQNFDLKEEIRSYWSDRAATFDDSPSHLIENQYGLSAWQDFICRSFELGPDQMLIGKQVLDIACGTGEISRVLCSLGAEVVGLDFSEKMHARAKEKLMGKSWSPLLCDAENLLGVVDDAFDFAVTRHLAWTLTKPEKAYAEWRRVLKPGGRLLLVDGNWEQGHSFLYRLRRQFADFLSPLPAKSPKETAKDQWIRKQLPYRNGLTLEHLRHDLVQAGFVSVQKVSVSALYGQGMKAWPLPVRLRQSSENRFALVCTAP